MEKILLVVSHPAASSRFVKLLASITPGSSTRQMDFLGITSLRTQQSLLDSGDGTGEIKWKRTCQASISTFGKGPPPPFGL